MKSAKNLTRTRLLVLAATAIALTIAASAAAFSYSKSRTSQLFGKIVHRVETDQKIVALTFDDGPTKHWPQNQRRPQRQKRQSHLLPHRTRHRTRKGHRAPNRRRRSPDRQPQLLPSPIPPPARTFRRTRNRDHQRTHPRHGLHGRNHLPPALLKKTRLLAAIPQPQRHHHHYLGRRTQYLLARHGHTARNRGLRNPPRSPRFHYPSPPLVRRHQRVSRRRSPDYRRPLPGGIPFRDSF